MKALLLAGGHGTRLRPITHTSSKQLIPIANKPILFYGLEAIAEAGIEDVGIIVGDTEEEIRRAVGDGSKWGLRVRYIRQDQPLGLAHAVLTAKDFLGDDPFLMYLGDNLVRQNLKDFVGMFESIKPKAQIFLVKVREPERFGVAVVDGNQVVRLVEKPKERISDLALCGVYIFSPEIVHAASSIEPSWRGELEITDAIQYLLDHGHEVRAEHITGWWKDTGKLEDLLEANQFVLDAQERSIEGDVDESTHITGNVHIERGAVVKESVIRGPVTIASGCRIERSIVDPYTSLYFNSALVDCELGNSIVMEECYLEDVRRIRDSLIGRNVRIVRGADKPAAFQLMVGDNCAISLP